MKKVYYRRKLKSMIIEGKRDGKAIHIWTLPHPEKLLAAITQKSSIFTQEEIDKLMQKINSLDNDAKKVRRSSQEVHLIDIKRNFEQ